MSESVILSKSIGSKGSCPTMSKSPKRSLLFVPFSLSSLSSSSCSSSSCSSSSLLSSASLLALCCSDSLSSSSSSSSSSELSSLCSLLLSPFSLGTLEGVELGGGDGVGTGRGCRGGSSGMSS